MEKDNHDFGKYFNQLLKDWFEIFASLDLTIFENRHQMNKEDVSVGFVMHI